MTEKQKRFCEEYLIDCNATQAAIRAGYSAKTAYSIGNENLTKPEIEAYIKEKLEELQSERIADVKEVMEYLTAVMRREKTENVVVTISEEKSEYTPDDKGTMRRQTVKIEKPVVVEIPAKLTDANKAAELLGKRYGIFKDNISMDVITPVFSGESEIED